MSNQEFHQRRLSATPRGVGVMCNFFARTAENATLTDVEGNDYIDFAAGIAVLNTGHRHPEMVAAVEKQLHQFTHTAYQIVPYESYVSLAEKLNELAPVQARLKPRSSRRARKRWKMPLKSPGPTPAGLA
jgi:4-aminobutyrate aminotransferase